MHQTEGFYFTHFKYGGSLKFLTLNITKIVNFRRKKKKKKVEIFSDIKLTLYLVLNKRWQFIEEVKIEQLERLPLNQVICN